MPAGSPLLSPPEEAGCKLTDVQAQGSPWHMAVNPNVGLKPSPRTLTLPGRLCTQEALNQAKGPL